MNPALLARLSEVQTKIADLAGIQNVEAILNQLSADLEAVDEYEAGTSLSLRIEALCRQYKSAPVEARRIHRWYWQRVNDLVRVDLTPVNSGQKLWLWVDHDFYRRRLSRMLVYVDAGDVFVYPHDQRLAHLVANYHSAFGFYSVHCARNETGILDLRWQNLKVNFDKQEREHRKELHANQNRELIGAVGRDCGQLSDADVAEHIVSTAAEGRMVTIAGGSRKPVDGYRSRMFQIGGKRVDQAFNLADATTDYVPDRPTAKARKPDGEGFSATPRGTSQAVKTTALTVTGKSDNRPIEDDVQHIPDIRLNPKAKIKPKSKLGANGIERQGTLERSTPPWEELWEGQ